MDDQERKVGQIEQEAIPAGDLAAEDRSTLPSTLANDEETSQMQASAPTPGESATEAAPAVTSPTKSEEQADTPPMGIEALKPGMRLKGVVRNVLDFGAFIDIGVGRDGLAHISTLKRAGIDKTVRPGDELDVQIRRVDVGKNRISLTIPGAGRGSKASLKDLEVNSTVTGRVVRLVDFGAFVDIGAQTDGLVHISQFPGGFVRHPREVVQVGDEVQVRILEIDTERRRISLSMKEIEPVAEEPQPQPQQETDQGERLPTAFEVAWQEALARSGRSRRASR